MAAGTTAVVPILVTCNIKGTVQANNMSNLIRNAVLYSVCEYCHSNAYKYAVVLWPAGHKLWYTCVRGATLAARE